MKKDKFNEHKRYKKLFGKLMQSRVGSIPHLPVIFYLHILISLKRSVLWLLGGWGVAFIKGGWAETLKVFFSRRGGGV